MNADRILVVDDNEVFSDLLCQVLSEEGYTPDRASTAEDALERMRDVPYHLLLVDLKLPGMSGIELLREVRSRSPETDVVTITSYASMETAVEAIRLGAFDYLLKPLDELEIVTQVVNRALEKRRMTRENDRLNREVQLKNASLEHYVKRLSALNSIGQGLHSILDFRELLSFFIRAVAVQLEAERASLLLFEKNSDELVIMASVGIDEDLAQKVRIRKGEGIAGWVAERGEALLVENIDRDRRFEKRRERSYGTDSFISAPLVLSVPIQFQNRTLGVINVNNKVGGGVFTDEDLEFVTNLASQAAVAAAHALMFQDLEATRFEAIMALAEAIEFKDASTGRHSDRLLTLAVRVADRMGLTAKQKDHLRYAAVLHDIGKIGVPEHILQKPASLSNEEYAIIKEHPRLGAQILRKISFLEDVAQVIFTHHEWYDGTGYPSGIAGEDIPIVSRIVAIMDAYDAMISDRPYRKALGHESAITQLRAFAGRQFDPQVVEVFLSVLASNGHGEDGQHRRYTSDSIRSARPEPVQ
jgi:putative nucleotidyltransferase with HDIG domain